MDLFLEQITIWKSHRIVIEINIRGLYIWDLKVHIYTPGILFKKVLRIIVNAKHDNGKCDKLLIYYIERCLFISGDGLLIRTTVMKKCLLTTNCCDKYAFQILHIVLRMKLTLSIIYTDKILTISSTRKKKTYIFTHLNYWRHLTCKYWRSFVILGLGVFLGLGRVHGCQNTWYIFFMQPAHIWA